MRKTTDRVFSTLGLEGANESLGQAMALLETNVGLPNAAVSVVEGYILVMVNIERFAMRQT